jgi:hypothetical protein
MKNRIITIYLLLAFFVVQIPLPSFANVITPQNINEVKFKAIFPGGDYTVAIKENGGGYTIRLYTKFLKV